MDTQRLFGPTMQLVQKNLGLRAQRHNLLASNIANIDTPNFKAFDIMVDEEMKKDISTGHEAGLFRTQPEHFPLREHRLDRSGVVQVDAPEFSMKKDGNTVDVDKTMSNLAENGLLYNASAQIMGKKFQGLTDALYGGKR
ncbi:MAG: flagellar basal body rod protein FlgB [Desulfatirhabdiaceae bacterium]